jgi:hypothetical protein
MGGRTSKAKNRKLTEALASRMNAHIQNLVHNPIYDQYFPPFEPPPTSKPGIDFQEDPENILLLGANEQGKRTFYVVCNHLLNGRESLVYRKEYRHTSLIKE